MLHTTYFRYIFALLSLLPTLAHAQAGSQPQLLAMATPPTPTGVTKAKTTLLTGRVETATGSVLPGAVVEVQSNQRLRAVTDADGIFHLTVPAAAAPVAVTASFGGYQDVSASLVPGAMPAVLRLVVAHEVKLAHRQQLETCLKVARRQVNRQLRQIRP